MQLRILIAAAIYLGSYLPLSLILLAQDIDLESVKRGICPVWSIITLSCASPFKNPFWSLGAVAVCAMGMAATFVALRALRTTQRVKVIESKHIPADLINYVIPYVVSFISLDFEQGAKLIGFAVFLSWIFWITYRSGQIVLNPVLAAFGWKLFEVSMSITERQRFSWVACCPRSISSLTAPTFRVTSRTLWSSGGIRGTLADDYASGPEGF